MGSLPNLRDLTQADDALPNRTGALPLVAHKSRSDGAHNHTWDDNTLLEQVASYSPISTRNLAHSIAPLTRRRDSMSSSIGATSVRRLIAVVRHSHGGRPGPVYTRRTLMRNVLALCASHFISSTTLYPFLALQGSVSSWAPIPATGSFLLAILHLFGSLSALLGPFISQKMGTGCVLVVAHTLLVAFYVCHLYPKLYIILPAYIVFGTALGPATLARITLLMTLSAKLSYTAADDDVDAKEMRRTCILRRVSRALQGAQDVGLIAGSILAALVITQDSPSGANLWANTTEVCNCTGEFCIETNEVGNATSSLRCSYVTTTVPQKSNVFDEDRVCGSNACPVDFFNTTSEPWGEVLTYSSTTMLACIFISLAAVALTVVAVGLNRPRACLHHDLLDRNPLRVVGDTFRDARLELAAPLAFFIGAEQAFMYADFGKSYVVCTLGVNRLNLVFLCMGLLQSIAACTLSMLLRTIRRHIVIAVGFTFHACLLMVQVLWKPSGDDPALFYVISAAWGVCNAIWEMLSFTLLTSLFSDDWEPAFANSIFFKHLGLAFAFLLHGLICNWIKLYGLAVLMVVAVGPLAYLELKLESLRKVKNPSRL